MRNHLPAAVGSCYTPRDIGLSEERRESTTLHPSCEPDAHTSSLGTYLAPCQPGLKSKIQLPSNLEAEVKRGKRQLGDNLHYWRIIICLEFPEQTSFPKRRTCSVTAASWLCHTEPRHAARLPNGSRRLGQPQEGERCVFRFQEAAPPAVPLHLDLGFCLASSNNSQPAS